LRTVHINEERRIFYSCLACAYSLHSDRIATGVGAAVKRRFNERQSVVNPVLARNAPASINAIS
jgi:hypothetical protein